MPHATYRKKEEVGEHHMELMVVLLFEHFSRAIQDHAVALQLVAYPDLQKSEL